MYYVACIDQSQLLCVLQINCSVYVRFVQYKLKCLNNGVVNVKINDLQLHSIKYNYTAQLYNYTKIV